MVFRKLGIIDPIIKVIEEERFEKPSEIQEKTIPLVLEGKDVIGGAATGSGKTLAFGAGIIHSCEKGRGLQALVLTPTRELAEQVANALIKFSRYKPLHVVTVYGGVSINPQIDNLRTADVVVGTPGRVLDHIDRRTINLSRVKLLVLDEADRMLDMGFIDDVEKIVHHCPRQRQTLLFSATITEEVARLSHRYMNEPVKVSAESYVDPSKLHQVYYDVEENRKLSLLIHLLKNESAGLVMVFCNSRNTVDFVSRNLRFNGIDSQAIHGGYSQAKRSRVITQFHSQRVLVLICTDVAARGLDIPGVSHVYNYDIPKDSKQYVHRIGRTARAGKEGKAINFLSQRDYENFDRVLRDNSLEIKKEATPQLERIEVRRVEQRRGGFGRPQWHHGNREGGQRGQHGRREHGENSSDGQRTGSRRFSRRPRSSWGRR